MNQKNQLISGCMRWDKWGKQLSVQDMSKLIEHLLDQGINYFDHADIYGDYTTEAKFGEAMASVKCDRKDYKICTKTGLQIPNVDRNNQTKHYQYDYDYIIESAIKSIEKLNCDYIDMFLLHRPSPLMNEAEIAEAVQYLKKENLITHFGVSNWQPYHLDTLSEKVDIATNQIEISLTQSSVLEDGTLDRIKMLKIPAMAWSPLGDFYNRSDDDQVVVAVHALAAKYQVDTSAILINWILQLPIKVDPVIGSTNLYRIKTMQKAFTFDMELEDWFLLWEKARGKEVD